ncbi:MAG: hypothetical protein IJ057_07010 [Bacteroidales bacterium]|nr:hypothetical protein [Bacteroidales bacterium]
MTTRRLHTMPHRFSRRVLRQAEWQAHWLAKGMWWLGKNKFIRFLATDAKTGIGFCMGGNHPTCGRLYRVGVMARKAFYRFATMGFAYEGKLTEY